MVEKKQEKKREKKMIDKKLQQFKTIRIQYLQY